MSTFCVMSPYGSILSFEIISMSDDLTSIEAVSLKQESSLSWQPD